MSLLFDNFDMKTTSFKHDSGDSIEKIEDSVDMKIFPSMAI